LVPEFHAVPATSRCAQRYSRVKRCRKQAAVTEPAFGLHGVGGIVGAILTAFFASEFIMGDNAPANVMHQLWVQVEGVLATIAYSAIMTFIILKVIDLIIGIRVASDDERMGLDLSQHGERVE
jgi:ammonium transporter, Amt family